MSGASSVERVVEAGLEESGVQRVRMLRQALAAARALHQVMPPEVPGYLSEFPKLLTKYIAWLDRELEAAETELAVQYCRRKMWVELQGDKDGRELIRKVFRAKA